MLTKTFTVAIIGAHGSGKTTLGREVANHMGTDYDEEIGRILREEALAKNQENHALNNQPAFDQKVIHKELERDLSTTSSRIVETWHPGNLAYAYERSPNIARMYEDTTRAMIANIDQTVVVQPLRISIETALERLSEPGADDPKQTVKFFRRVARHSEKLAKKFGLTVLKPIYTDQLCKTKTVRAVIDNLASKGISPSVFL